LSSILNGSDGAIYSGSLRFWSWYVV
jgi:hypothetical protein